MLTKTTTKDGATSIKCLSVACAIASLVPTNLYAADTFISGFGSIVGTSLLSDEGYWVKHPTGAGFYQDDVGFELKEESLLGLQGTIKYSENLSLTAQVISRGQLDWKPDVEQFYGSYDINHNWNIKLGKMRNPVYLYSDSMDIHYSFGWVRTPSSSYSLSSNYFEGLSAMYTGEVAGISNRTIVYAGKLDKNPDRFLTELFVNRGFNTQFTTGETGDDGNFIPLESYRRHYENLYGITTEFFVGDWTAHLAFMEGGDEKGINTYINGTQFVERFPWRDFYDVALSYDDGEWLAIAEWNRFVDVYSSYYFTLGRTVDDWQYLVTYGDFEGELRVNSGVVLPDSRQEFTSSLAFTARYDIAPGMALKAELIQFENENSLIIKDLDNDGKIESTVLSVALDFVF